MTAKNIGRTCVFISKIINSFWEVNFFRASDQLLDGNLDDDAAPKNGKKHRID